METFDIYAIETIKNKKQAYIGSAREGHSKRYLQHLHEAKLGITDKDIWLRCNLPDISNVLLDQVTSRYEAHSKELKHILQYFKNGYGIINTVNPVTGGELPLCILMSIRLAYGYDDIYSRLHDYRYLGLTYRDCCSKYINDDIIETLEKSGKVVTRLYEEYNV